MSIKLFESWSDEYILDFRDAGFTIQELGDKLVGEYKGNYVTSDINVWYAELIDRLDYKYTVTSSNLTFSKKNKIVKFEVYVNLKYGPIFIDIKTDNKKYNKIGLYPYKIKAIEHHTVRLNTKNRKIYKTDILNNYFIEIICKKTDDSSSHLYVCESQMRNLKVGPNDSDIVGFNVFYWEKDYKPLRANIDKGQLIELIKILPKLGKIKSEVFDNDKTVPLSIADKNKIEDIGIDAIKNYK